jgi:ribosomal protein S18 acetylase RimI-like enzyme
MIREAKLADAKAISQLISGNLKTRKKNKSTGFLRYKRNPQKVKKIIKKSIVALVYFDNNKIIGFMNAYPTIKYKNKKYQWQSQKIKNDYYDRKQSAVAYLGAIDPNYLHQGIGSQLYQRMVEDLKNKGYNYLFASVTTKPVKNNASWGFVKSKGFKIAATVTSPKKQNKELTLFAKKL